MVGVSYRGHPCLFLESLEDLKSYHSVLGAGRGLWGNGGVKCPSKSPLSQTTYEVATSESTNLPSGATPTPSPGERPSSDCRVPSCTRYPENGPAS